MTTAAPQPAKTLLKSHDRPPSLDNPRAPRKRKGGMGAALGVGLALSFGYIMLQTVSATFAIQANFPPVLAAWLPNFLFAIVAYFCYRKAPR